MTKSELRSIICEVINEELKLKRLSEATGQPKSTTEFTTPTDAEFKKEFISFLIKNYPENMAAYEILNKVDFRSWTGTNSDPTFDIQNGIFRFPQSFAEEKDYKGCARYLWRTLSLFIRGFKKLTELHDSLEDIRLD